MAAAFLLALAGGEMIFLRSERAPRPAPPAAPRPVTRPAGIAAPSDEITLVTDHPTGHAPVGSAVLVTASTPPASDPSARVSLYSQRLHGPRILLSAAGGSSCTANWTPHVPGRYVLTATAQSSQGQIPISLHLKMTVDPVKSPVPPRPRASANRVAAQFPRRHDADALANRQRRRGIPAMVRPILGRDGAPAYRVETGIHGRIHSARLPGIM